MEASQELDIVRLILPLAIIVLIIAIGVVLLYQQFQKNIIRQRLEKEELKSQYQKELLQTTINVQEEERKRIARDLHDELGAALSIGRMQLVQLENQQEIDPKKLSKIRELVEETLASTRRISHELMPLQLTKLGLEKALLALLEKVEGSNQLQTQIAIGLKGQKLPWLQEIALYRIYSELINNTLKHAEANTIEISIWLESEQLFCRYADNGIGINKKVLEQGLGLKSLESRIKAFEGTLKSGNRNEGGFFANMKIPIPKETTT